MLNLSLQYQRNLRQTIGKSTRFFMSTYILHRYTGKIREKDSKDYNAEEVKRLKRIIRAEKKGAERELKLDAAYLARKKSLKRKELDDFKKEKGKEVFNMTKTKV